MDTKWISAIPVPALVVAGDDTLVAVNEPFATLFPHAEIGRSYLTVFRQPEVGDVVTGAHAGNRAIFEDIRIGAGTGQKFSVIGAPTGEGSALICLQSEDETAAAAQMRRDFVADLSHELRTPLTAMRGIFETATDDADALAHFLPTLTREADRMNALVSDLLTLSQVESNAMRRPTDVVTLSEVVSQACSALEATAKLAKTRIDLTVPDAAISLPGDADDLTRAITNLVVNAIRYGTPGGPVEVTLNLPETDLLPGIPAAVISVSNHGPGVEPHHIPRLTERFYRVDDHRGRNSGGTGLGLAIVKHVVTRHRGRVLIQSAPDEGMKVRLILPVPDVEQTA